MQKKDGSTEMSSFTSQARMPTIVTFLFSPLVLSSWTSSRVPIGRELLAKNIKAYMRTAITKCLSVCLGKRMRG
eukprot:2008291-Pleurochrysis_carterae.AAC.1